MPRLTARAASRGKNFRQIYKEEIWHVKTYAVGKIGSLIASVMIECLHRSFGLSEVGITRKKGGATWSSRLETPVFAYFNILTA